MILSVNTDRFQRVKEIFTAVCDSAADDRSQVLNTLCNGCNELRSDVQALLDHAELPAFDLDAAAAQLGNLIADASSNGHSLVAPVQIGAYQILQLIGEGGMGVVYLARQERPQRSVALKVIRPGFATPSLVRRFEHEAHVLGRLQHPHIAQIYEAGLAPTGGRVQPFLVMEYVDGIDVLQYARKNVLDESDRVRLMIDVCNAVQHAHLRGVIHRDLKPANILVNTAGDTKVLDFGVARVTDSADAHFTIAPTAQGQVVGTLAYMSPEQLAGDRDSIDTRSDVYALGVLLFELLTGMLPYEVTGRPGSDAYFRATENFPPQRANELHGDLRTIVLKTIHPSRERRYQSALELAEDLQRYLDGEPISARRDSMAYVVRRRLRRYRGIFAASIVLLVATALYALHSVRQANVNAALAQREREAREAADQSRQDAQASEQQATHRRDESQAVTAFLMTMLKMADPDVTEDFDTSVRTLLADASQRVGGSFEQFPEAEAEIRGYLGRIYATLGDLDEAESHLRRAITLHDAQTDTPSESMYALLWPFLHIELDVNDVVASNPRLRTERLGRSMIAAVDEQLASQFAMIRRVPRREIPATRAHEMAQELSALLREKYQASDRVWLLAADQLHLLGLSHRLSSHPAHAAEYFAAALDLYRAALNETNPRVARTLGEYTEALLEAARFNEAEVVAQQSLDLLRRKLPADHWYVQVYEARVARAQLHQGHAQPALSKLQSCYSAIVAERGESSPLATTLLVDIIRHFDKMGQPEGASESRRLYARGLAVSAMHVTVGQARLALHADHPEVVSALEAMEQALSQRDREKIAESLERVVAISRDQIDSSSAFAGLIADLLTGWGGPYAPAALSYDARFALLDEARRITEACPHRHGRKIGGTYWWLADLYLRQRQADDAFKTATIALHNMQISLPEHDTFIAVAQSLLSAAIMQQGRVEEAFDLAVSSYSNVVKGMGNADANALIAMGRVLHAASALNRIPEVSPLVIENLQPLLLKAPASDRCLLAAGSIVPHAQLPAELYDASLRLMRGAGAFESLNTWGKTMYAAALYRTGRFAEAREALQPIAGSAKPNVTALAFYAMACSRLNFQDEASTALTTLSQLKAVANAKWPDIESMLLAEARQTQR